MAKKTPMLEIKNLTIRLPESADREFAVEEANISVHRGEIVAYPQTISRRPRSDAKSEECEC